MMLLDVIIALAFIYMSGAIFCSFLLEAIAAWTRGRAAMLREAVTDMLGEQGAQKLYGHPMVSAMFERHDRPPSYLPSGVFARAVLDGLRAPVDWIRPITADEARNAIQQITHLPLRDHLASLYGAAGGDLALFEKNLAAWFEQVAGRMTGWYRRKIQSVLLVVAAVVVVVFNLDVFTMFKTLWTNAALREALVAGAVEASSSDAGALSGEQARATLESLPLGWSGKAAMDAGCGWGSCAWSAATRAVGWLISIFAIALGAPFWFDLLKRLVDLRATGFRVKPTTLE